MDGEIIKKIVADLMEVDIHDFTSETKLVDLGCDSLDIYQIVYQTELQFGVKIPDDKMESILSVGDIVELLKTL
ncbi:MAG: acyl carrier protein [Lachnospiraceae bacterium]|nr:acyl carrier protein [Lachnospiraceae bacterium]